MKKTTKIITAVSSVAFLFSIVASYFITPHKPGGGIIAKIGESKLTAAEYHNAYQRNLQYIQNAMGQPLTEEQIKMLKVKQNTMQGLLQQHMLEALIKKENLLIPKATVFEQIAQLPYFKDQNGKFSQERFREVLKANNISESDYIEDFSNNMIKSVAVEALTGYRLKKNKVVDRLFQHKTQSRSVDIVFLKQETAPTYSPSEQEIQEFFIANQQKFQTTEFRTVQYIEIDSNSIEKDIQISNEEVDREFQKNIASYDDYIRKDITSILFSNQEDADSYTANSSYKKDFETFVKSLDPNKAIVTTLNNVDTQDLPEALRDQISALQEDEISDVFRSPMGWHIIKIEKTHQLDDKAIADIKEEIKKDLLEKRRSDQLYQTVNNIEKSLIEDDRDMSKVAAEYQLKLQTSPPLEIPSNLQDAELELEDLSSIRLAQHFNPRIISKIFKLQKNEIASIDISNENEEKYLFVKLTGITPSEPQSIETAKPEIIKMLRAQYIQNRAMEKAQNIAMQIAKDQNAALSSIDRDRNISLQKAQLIYRTTTAPYLNPTQQYPKEFVDEVFAIGVGQTTKPYVYKDGVLLATLKSIDQPEDSNSAAAKHMAQQLNNVIHSLTHDDLFNYLHSKFKVTIYHSPFEQK